MMNYSTTKKSTGSRSCSKVGALAMARDIYGNSREVPAEPKRHWASPVVTFTNGKKANGHNDSDRLWFANVDKYNEVSQRLFGDQSQLWWDSRTPEQVECFLREYFDNPKLVLVEIQKMYNVSNGGPIWGFSYQY
jgi:hypothetical protein